jgi:hypothetical protein
MIPTMANATFPPLPSMGDCANMRPVIVTDSREQTPLVFRNLATVIGTLVSGDYAPLGFQHFGPTPIEP